MSFDLEHIMRINYTNPLNEQRTFLYNCRCLNEEETIRILKTGEYSPYALDITSEQFEGVFFAQGADHDVSVGEPSGTVRANIRPGLLVDIVLKKDQPTGALTRGRVSDILTHSPQHPRGIKVRLTDGQVGRVQRIIQIAKQGHNGVE